MSPGPTFDVDSAHRWFAVECNNTIFQYLEKDDRSEEETERMIGYAHAALLHWQLYSGHKMVNTVRGVSMIATAYAYAARAEEALHYAEWNVALVEEHSAEVQDFDRCYACMAMARALASNADTDDAREWRLKCEQQLALIANEEDRKICLADYQAGPWYGADHH